ncbi:MAG: glycosyltransferase [Acidimicrobiales bacterium]
MRTAVYNRYWSTGGGAEKYGGVIAQVLSGDGPLDILTHDPVDVDWLAERLHLDLAKVNVRLVDDVPGAVTRTSAEYDLFVNVSYMSNDRAGTDNSLYVVHFPSTLDGHRGPVRRFLHRRSDRLVHALVPVEMDWGDGFHHRDPGSRSLGWTSGAGVLHFVTRPGRPVSVTLTFTHQRPPELGPTPVRVEVDGRPAAEVVLERPPSRLQARRGASVTFVVESPDRDVPVEVKVVSDTFVPAEVMGGSDRRRLGVCLKSVRVGSGPFEPVMRHLPLAIGAPSSARWTNSYGALVANSEFTREWVKRWWECDTEVLYPPVSMHPRRDKAPIILNVGRFFDADLGHSKKQLEMVRAFRDLCDRGVTGWTLHLLGGCVAVGDGYFDQVRRAAEGYPVELHPNASGEEKDGLYGRASIYWHASGFGENPQRHPGRLEHFGITTVEAMSAGAVPVVIGRAGQLETVRHGVDGYHFHTLDELTSLSESLIGDEARLAEMSAAAETRAREFSIDAFEGRLRTIVERVRRSASSGG